MNHQRSNPVIVLVLLMGVFGISDGNAQDNGQRDVVGPVGQPVESSGPVFDENAVVKSHTQQFSISGGTSADRGTIANLAESMKSQFLLLLGEEDAWSVPITIRMVGERGDPVGLRSTVLKLRYNDRGYEVGMFVSLSRGIEKLEFQRSLISGLVYERALRDKGKESLEVALSVPPWFSEGLLEAISWKRKETDRRLYEALFRHGGLYQMDDLFTVSAADFLRIDAASEAAFRVSSGALLMALLEQPKGKEGMHEILAELPAFEGETPALLRRHFPELNLSQRSLEKWWSLQLANKGSAPLTEVIGVIKTDERLTDALKLRYRDPEGEVQEVAVEDWSLLGEMKPAVRKNAVSMAQQDLVSLSYRCFPSYRPLLSEYQQLLNGWITGETEGLSATFEALAGRRRNMVAKAQRARDFLDWFEITRARETSGVFEDYLKLKSQLKTQADSKKDRISEYLDRMDRLFTPQGE